MDERSDMQGRPPTRRLVARVVPLLDKVGNGAMVAANQSRYMQLSPLVIDECARLGPVPKQLANDDNRVRVVPVPTPPSPEGRRRPIQWSTALAVQCGRGRTGLQQSRDTFGVPVPSCPMQRGFPIHREPTIICNGDVRVGSPFEQNDQRRPVSARERRR